MGQITENTCQHIIDAAKRKERFPLTIWEQEQLAHAWLLLQRHKQTLKDIGQFCDDNMTRMEALMSNPPKNMVAWSVMNTCKLALSPDSGDDNHG